MTEFKISVGMSTNTIKNNIDKLSNVTNKTKQLIFNFCKNDQDHKVSNEIELSMLESWANGSEKVKMPTPEGMQKLETNTPIGYSFFGLINENKSLYRASKNRLFQLYQNYAASSHYADGTANSPILDVLNDKDQDGYADSRFTIYSKEIYNTKHNNESKETTYEDNDLDGIPDIKSVETTTSDIKNDKTIDIITTIETNLHTGKSTKKVEKEIW